MKKIVIALVTLCLVISCSKSDDSIDQTPVTEGKGNIAFSFSINNSRLNKDSGNAVYSKMDQIPFQIIVTIFDDNGTVIKNEERYNLTNFNGSYTTENIELTTGNYVLTGFNVVNADNEVILSAPIEGSEFADLVTTPLPISFTVNEGATSTLNPEVLRIEPVDTPEQFGYVSFTFNVIETVNLYIQLLENGASVSTGSVKIGNIPDNDFIERDLSVGVNTIRIPLNDFNSQSIQLEVTYPNFPVRAITLQPAELDQYSLTNPFIVNFQVDQPAPDTMITATEEFEFTMTNGTVEPNLQQAAIRDINRLDINGQNYIVVSASNNTLVIINSNTKAGKVYTLRTDDNISTVRIVGETIVLISADQRYVLNDFESLSFTIYSNDNLNLSNSYSHNGSLFVIDGDNLYESSDFGVSFNILKSDIQFIFENMDVTFLNDYMYILDRNSGQVYRGVFTNDLAFEAVFTVGVDYSNMDTINNDLIFTGPSVANAGQLVSEVNNEFVMTNIEFELGPSDVLTNVANVDGENVLVFTTTVYRNFPGTNEFTFVKNIDPILKSTASGNNQEVWGISTTSSNTIYSNLRR